MLVRISTTGVCFVKMFVTGLSTCLLQEPRILLHSLPPRRGIGSAASACGSCCFAIAPLLAASAPSTPEEVIRQRLLLVEGELEMRSKFASSWRRQSERRPPRPRPIRCAGLCRSSAADLRPAWSPVAQSSNCTGPRWPNPEATTSKSTQQRGAATITHIRPDPLTAVLL